ncbi:MAG TPA: hypothetical protein VKE74_05530, partial [Gemmataceae bacterium]|nr:hypothetical protein [Gemmataceae bacterium]
MPTFLSDPTQSFYLILVAFVVVAGVIAARNQDRRSLITLAVALGAFLLVGLIDILVESPREGAVRAAQEMGHAADAKNPEAFVVHLADTIEYTGGQQPVKATKEQIRNSGFWSLLRDHNVRVTTWDYSRADVKEIDANTVEIGFMAKGEADGKPYPVYVRATFTRQPDGKMRVTKFATFNPANHNEP